MTAEALTQEQALDRVAEAATVAEQARARFEAAIREASQVASGRAISERAGLSKSRVHQIIAEGKTEAS